MLESIRSNKKNTTLVFESTSKKPWIGLFEHRRSRKGDWTGSFVWKEVVPVTGPGQFNYWRILEKKKRTVRAGQVFVVTGPGPFSVTRAAVNIANALGFAWDIPVLSSRAVKADVLLAKIKKIPGMQGIGGGFIIEDRALPYYKKPVQLGRSKKK